jgi:hypothetical protein
MHKSSTRQHSMTQCQCAEAAASLSQDMAAALTMLAQCSNCHRS